MRWTVLFVSLGLPLPVQAHIGHIADVAGHDHWIALGAIGLAAAAGLAAVLAGKGKDEQKDEPEEEAGGEEASA